MHQKQEAPWQKTFAAFAGPGIEHPSDTMRVTESEARTLLAAAAALEWQAPAYVGSGRYAGYLVRNAISAWSTALWHQEALVGFYLGSSLWIARPHRGLGLSTPLILAAAEHRGGGILPPGVVFQGYTGAGLMAHRAAHCHAVLTAIAEGRPVPAAVLEEMELSGRQPPQPAASLT